LAARTVLPDGNVTRGAAITSSRRGLCPNRVISRRFAACNTNARNQPEHFAHLGESRASHAGFVSFLSGIPPYQICYVLAFAIRETRVNRFVKAPIRVNGAERVWR
jgi:hypothetical protein